MNTDTLSAAPLTLRVADALVALVDDPTRPAASLAVEGLTTPQEVLQFAAGILRDTRPLANLAGVRVELAAVRNELHTTEEHARNLEEDNARLERMRRLAIDLHDLAGQTVTHLDALQAAGWDYDRARLLTAARELLKRNPWGDHDPAQEQAELRDAERLRVAAHTIHAADALQAASRSGDPERIRRATAGYERARRLYACHAAADTHPLTPVVIDTTLDHDQEPTGISAAAVEVGG